MAKVKTVKIDKKELIAETFRKKGLPELLSTINFTVDPMDKPETLIKKLISSIKTKFKKDFFSLPREEQLTYFEKLNIHPIYQVEMEGFEEKSEFGEYVNRLIKRGSTLHGTSQTPDVVKVTIRNGEYTYVGYSLLNGEITMNRHRTSREMGKGHLKHGYVYEVNLPALIAETIAIQSLVKFIEEHKSLLQYVFVRYFLLVGNAVPEEPDFQMDFKKVADQYHFDYSKAVESIHLNPLSPTFYGEKIKSVGTKEEAITIWDRGIQYAVREFIKEAQYAKYRAEEEYESRSDYARSYQTKKQIKSTHKEKMENNAFLKRYGYTELDNDVDLEKFKVVEENFEELISKIPIPKREDYSFRIKKLGKHRAAGIFYPSVKTTIFDVNHPDAFMHECFHQIDKILAEGIEEDYFSETMEFRPVYDAHKELLVRKVESLPKGHPLRISWESKNKYNKRYHLKPTEVFARTGEMYVSRKGLGENSLFVEEKELAKEAIYPFDETFMEMVMEFYDKMFDKIAKNDTTEREQKKEVKPEKASSSVSFKKTEQLKLF